MYLDKQIYVLPRGAKLYQVDAPLGPARIKVNPLRYIVSSETANSTLRFQRSAVSQRTFIGLQLNRRASQPWAGSGAPQHRPMVIH